MITTKAIFDRACRLYDEIGRLAKNGIGIENDIKGSYAEYNELIDKYDFSNRIHTSEEGLEGLDWCWGEAMIPAKYRTIKFYTTHGVPAEAVRAICSLDDKDYLVNCRGEEVFTADELKAGIGDVTPAPFRKGDKWGIVNSEGRIILEARYDRVTPDFNGYCFLSLDGKEGFIDPFGNVIEPRFDSIEIDSDDRLLVSLDGRRGYVDEAGEFTDDIDNAYYRYKCDLIF